MKCTVPPALDLTCNDKMRGLGRVGQALRYALNRKGLPGLPAAPIRAYIRTRAGLEAPDAALSWIPFLVGENFHLPGPPATPYQHVRNLHRQPTMLRLATRAGRRGDRPKRQEIRRTIRRSDWRQPRYAAAQLREITPRSSRSG